MHKQLSELVDELSIVNIKIFFCLNHVSDPNASDEKVAESSRRAESLNRYRSQLKNAIDEAIGNAGKSLKIYD